MSDQSFDGFKKGDVVEFLVKFQDADGYIRKGGGVGL